MFSSSAVEIAPRLGLAQFHLTNSTTFEEVSTEMQRRTRGGVRNDSIALAKFFFERQTGFYLLQIYTPLVLVRDGEKDYMAKYT